MLRKIAYMTPAETAEMEEKLTKIYYQHVPEHVHQNNCAPANWKPFVGKVKNCSIERHFFESIEYAEYKQILRTQEDPEADSFKMIAAKVFYCSGQVGWAIDDEGNRYTFGCDHKYREMDSAELKERGLRRYDSFDHFSVCTKCGNVYGCNSSG